MSPDEVLDVVRAAVARVLELDPASVSPGLPFAELAADSLALVEIVELVEEELLRRTGSTATFADDDLDRLQTVRAAADYAFARLAGAP